jgi:hypothetical protein
MSAATMPDHVQLRDTRSMNPVLAIARTEFQLRAARTSSLVLFLILCGIAYVAVPSPDTGRTLIQVNGHRAVYNSAALAISTAILCSTFLGLIGFYLVSNALRRDVLARTSLVIAATPVRNRDYIIGKLGGTIAFLFAVVVGCMLNVMVMQTIRGEAPIHVATYLSIYAAITIPTIIVICGIALLFETIPDLSGRVGDILYFFVWTTLLAVPAIMGMSAHTNAGSYLDVFGIEFATKSIQAAAAHTFGSVSMVSIGANRFIPGSLPWTFSGIEWTAGKVLTRIAPIVLIVPLAALATTAFNRFDPDRIGSAATGKESIRQLSGLSALTGAGQGILSVSARCSGVVRVALADVGLTFVKIPLVLVGGVAASILALVVPQSTLRGVVLPVAFVVGILVIGDLVTRDHDTGSLPMLYSTENVREHYIVARLLAAMLVLAPYFLVAMIRILIGDPANALSLLIGVAFMVSAGVAFGAITGTSKIFTGLFVLFMYVSLSSGRVPALDFAGLSQVATPAVRITYAAVTVAIGTCAVIWHRWRLV